MSFSIPSVRRCPAGPAQLCLLLKAIGFFDIPHYLIKLIFIVVQHAAFIEILLGPLISGGFCDTRVLPIYVLMRGVRRGRVQDLALLPSRGVLDVGARRLNHRRGGSGEERETHAEWLGGLLFLRGLCLHEVIV